MAKAIVLNSGQEIKNGWVFISKSNKRDKRGCKTFWYVKCPVCTEIREIRFSAIIQERIKSCGCLKNCVGNKSKDVSGITFFRLTAIRPIHKKDNCNRSLWLFKCNCKKQTFIERPLTLVRRGDTKSCGCLQKEIAKANCGNKHPFFNPDLTPEDRKKLRSDPVYVEWRISVFKRDKYTCQCCFKRGVYIESHHILNYYEHPELRTELDNGITLCKSCHKLFHKKYGRTKNNKQQLEEFITNFYEPNITNHNLQ